MEKVYCRVFAIDKTGKKQYLTVFDPPLMGDYFLAQREHSGNNLRQIWTFEGPGQSTLVSVFNG